MFRAFEGLENDFQRLTWEEGDEQERPQYWYGKYIQSTPEWWGILELMRMGVDFRYQHTVRGGSFQRGGYTIDFLLMVPPRPQPLEFRGGYWHEGQMGAQDAFRDAQLRRIFKVEKILAIYEPDMQSQETVGQALRKLILHG